MSTETTHPRQSWWRAVPLPDIDDGEAFAGPAAMLAHFAAMYRAHIEAYHEAMSAQRGLLPTAEQRAQMSPEELDAVGVPLRDAIMRHLYPAKAAWTAAALLSGRSAEDCWETYSDPQCMDELAWEWLVRHSGLTDTQLQALTTVPVKGEDGLY